MSIADMGYLTTNGAAHGLRQKSLKVEGEA